MSKYTTDKMVAWFEEFCSAANDLMVAKGRKGFDQEDVFIKHSIIAKLRAADALIEAADRIEGEHPLSCEYEPDARYTWPKRWDAMKAALKAFEAKKEVKGE